MSHADPRLLAVEFLFGIMLRETQVEVPGGQFADCPILLRLNRTPEGSVTSPFLVRFYILSFTERRQGSLLSRLRRKQVTASISPLEQDSWVHQMLMGGGKTCALGPQTGERITPMPSGISRKS